MNANIKRNWTSIIWCKIKGVLKRGNLQSESLNMTPNLSDTLFCFNCWNSPCNFMSTQSQIWKHHSKVASLNTFFDLSIEVSESISLQSKICLCFLLIQQFNVCIEFIKTITINKKIILKAIFFQWGGMVDKFC